MEIASCRSLVIRRHRILRPSPCQPGSRARAAGEHHRRSDDVGLSLLCFEGATPARVTTRRRSGRLLRTAAPRPGPAVRPSSAPASRRHSLPGLDASFENYRASTSIFCSAIVSERRLEAFGLTVVARCRVFSSYEEPTVDALAPGADEGRGRLRKATGSCQPSFDPWISEWGNPARVMPGHLCLNT